MSGPGCAEVRERLSEWIDEALAPEVQAEVGAHLLACPACRAERDRLERTVALLRQAPAVRAPAGFVDRVLARARPAPWPRRLLRRLPPPWRVRLPVSAAAVALVAVGALWLHERAPEVKDAATGGPSVSRRLDPPPPAEPGPAPPAAAPEAPPPAAAPPRSGPSVAPSIGVVPPAPPAAAPPLRAAERLGEARASREGLAPPGAGVGSETADRTEAQSPVPGPPAPAAAAGPRPAEEAPGKAESRAAPPVEPEAARRDTRAMAPSAGSRIAKESPDATARQAPRATPGPPVAGRLVAVDREAAARAVEALVERLGGQAVRGLPVAPGPGLALDLTLPEARYAELAPGLAQLGEAGVWHPEREPAPAVAGLRRLRIVVD